MLSKPIAAAVLIAVTATLTACGGTKTADVSNPAPSPVMESPLPTQAPAVEPSLSVTPSAKPPSEGSVATTSKPSGSTNATKPDSEASAPAKSEPKSEAQAPAKPKPPVAESSKPDDSLRALQPGEPQKLPTVDGVGPGTVEYMTSETSADRKLEQAILKTMPDYSSVSASSPLHYYYNRVDLNGDGQPEVLAYLVGSYTCGTGGCTMMVFEPKDDSYKLISRFTLVNAPVLVAANSTSGWKDLILYVSGGGAEPHYARMQYNGESYPGNPSVAPEIQAGSLNGTAVLADQVNASGGMPLEVATASGN